MYRAKLSLCILFLFSALPASAEETCKFNGKEIKTTDSNAVAKITGSVRCSYGEETVVGIEYLYDHGLLKKVREFYRPSGKKKQEYGILDPKGSPYGSDNRDGSCKSWRENGRLEAEEIYEKGRLITKHRYDDSGELRQIEMHGKSDSEKKTSIEFTADGKIEAIYCGTAFTEQKYRKLCGFEGKSKVALYSQDGKIEAYRTFLNGRVVETAELDAETGKTLASDKKAIDAKDGIKSDFYPNGKVKQETRYNSDNRYHGPQKEYSEDGTLVRDAEFENGFMTEEHLYYQNGQPKEHTKRARESGDEKSVVVHSKRYWDNGKPMSEGAYHELKRQYSFGLGSSWSYDDLEPFGKHTSWDESGKIASETYWDNGRRIRVRTFVDGQLSTDEELFPDGSRKSHTKDKGR